MPTLGLGGNSNQRSECGPEGEWASRHGAEAATAPVPPTRGYCIAMTPALQIPPSHASHASHARPGRDRLSCCSSRSPSSSLRCTLVSSFAPQ